MSWLTRVEEHDGLEAGELRVVDLHVPQGAHQLVHDPGADAGDVQVGGHGRVGRVARHDAVVAQQQDVVQVQRAPGQAQQQVLPGVGSQQRHLSAEETTESCNRCGCECT